MDSNTQNEFRKIWKTLRCKADCGSTGNYKSYTVSLGQDSTNAPTILLEFENSLNVIPTFFYDSVGNYSITFDKPLFNTPFDYVVLTGSMGDIAVGAVPVFYDALSIQTSFAGSPQDNILGHHYPTILEIRVYN